MKNTGVRIGNIIAILIVGFAMGHGYSEWKQTCPVICDIPCIQEIQEPLEPVVEFLPCVKDCPSCEINCEDYYNDGFDSGEAEGYESGYIDGEYDGRSKAIEEAKMYN